MTVEDYNAMVEAQGGVCAVCKKPETAKSSVGHRSTKRLSIDHDHETGAVRALLCGRCNAALGLLLEDVAVIEALAEYVREKAHLVR